jgi:hypothetical protein
MSNDSDKDSERRDSGGDRDRDKLVVKSRQRTAIACNYCRRRKVSDSNLFIFYYFISELY